MTGLAYPPQPCGLPYKEFKSGWTYRDAYEHVAWGRGEGPRTVTQRTVLREMAKLKKDEYQRYKDDCAIGDGGARDDDEGEYAEEGDTSFDFSGVGGKQKRFSFMQKPKFAARRPRRSKRAKDEPKVCRVAGSVRTCAYTSKWDDHRVEHVTLSWQDAGSRLAQGWFEMDRDDDGDQCQFVVSGAFIHATHMNRGIGTRLYEAAAAEARRHGCRLASDKTRSVYSEAFWRKQERKGRAECGGRRGGLVYDEPVLSVKHQCAEGRIPRATCKDLLDTKRWPKPDGNLWPCRNWVLKYPPPDSLAGARKRKR